MPRNLRWHPDAWSRLVELPEQLRKEALTAVGALLADPMPAGSQTYEPVPDTYRLDTAQVSIFYRIVGEEIDVVLIWPNS